MFLRFKSNLAPIPSFSKIGFKWFSPAVSPLKPEWSLCEKQHDENLGVVLRPGETAASHATVKKGFGVLCTDGLSFELALLPLGTGSHGRTRTRLPNNAQAADVRAGKSCGCSGHLEPIWGFSFGTESIRLLDLKIFYVSRAHGEDRVSYFLKCQFKEFLLDFTQDLTEFGFRGWRDRQPICRDKGHKVN